MKIEICFHRANKYQCKDYQDCMYVFLKFFSFSLCLMATSLPMFRAVEHTICLFLSIAKITLKSIPMYSLTSII